MRSLPDDLLAAQKSASAVPYVQVEVLDYIGGVRRLAWQRLYSGSESDGYHAAHMPSDGSLLRARVAEGQLYYQRVASPGPDSNFASWTALPAAGGGVALAGQGADVLLFYVGSDGVTIYLRQSDDNGQSFGSATALTTAAATVTWLAAAVKGDGTALLIYAAGATIYSLKRSSATWGSPQAWTNSLASLAGLACHYYGDFNVVVAGSDSSGAWGVWSCIYGDGYSQAIDTWSTLRELVATSPGADVELRAPSLHRPDTYRLFFVEKYVGNQSYSRPYFSYGLPTADFVSNLWREPVPFDLASEYGLALTYDSNYAWLSCPFEVWRASLSPGTLDVTADVLAVTSEDAPSGGWATIVLRNDDGRYAGLLDGTDPVLKLGSEVRVSPGYRTPQGLRVSSGPAFWIQELRYEREGGRSTLTLRAHDAWGLLASWRARRQFVWGQGERNVFQLLAFVLARAGLEVAALGPTSSTLSNHYPAFTIYPGESGATAVRRLLAMVPDVLFFRGAFGYVKEPRSDEASSYAYGTDHPVLWGRYGVLLPSANRAQVFGDGLMAEEFRWDSVEGVYDRLRQVHDLNLDSVAKAQDRAQAELRRQDMTRDAGEVVVPVNCGQELYDVVEVTDPLVGLTAARQRVLGLAVRYDAGGRGPRYQQRLRLGAV